MPNLSIAYERDNEGNRYLVVYDGADEMISFKYPLTEELHAKIFDAMMADDKEAMLNLWHKS